VCGLPTGKSAAQAGPVALSPPPHRREVLLIAAAAVAAAVMTFALMVLRRGPLPALAAAPAVAAAEHPVSAGALRATSLPAPSSNETWSADRALWLGRQRGAAFELLAENKVSTWFGLTQPMLVVRCSSRTTEVFVYTQSPARIEAHVDGKTVTVSIDGEPTKTERWGDSDDRRELFAPDGAAFARRLLHAQTLRFGYTPHNSNDVVAQFHVTGLAELLQPVAKECGWKE